MTNFVVRFRELNDYICNGNNPELLDRLWRLAYTDSLTGVYSRNMFEEIRDRLDDAECLVTIVDLDSLKELNDNYGHNSGDCAIKRVAKDLIVISPYVFRLGGDEFLIINDKNHVRDVRLRLKDIPYISYGCAIKSGTDDISDTMSKADAAMYLHKRSKKIGRRKENSYD